MNYGMIRNDENFDILERDTETLIVLKCIEKKAREYCNRLNDGTGFAGWTPTFFASQSRKARRG